MKRNELNAASHANHSGESGAMCCSPSLGQMSTYWPLAPYSMSVIRGVRCQGEWHASGGMAGLALIPQIRLAKQATVLSLRNTGLPERADAARCAAPAP